MKTDELSPIKQKAIKKTEGACLILAGTGTGKTFTIVKKIAYLIQNEIYKPSEILCLTFSNEATNNLKEEVEKELKKRTDITIRTFHGFSADVLREFGHMINIDPGFEILLPDDAKVFLYKDLGVSPFNADRYISSISTAKDFGLTVKDIEEYKNKLKEQFKDIENIDEYADEVELELQKLHLNPSETKEQRKETRERKKEIKSFLEKYNEFKKYSSFVDVWKKYKKMKKEKNYLDYSDLNSNVVSLFRAFGAEDTAKRFKYVLIDEFQDTNKLQFELITFLAKEH